MGLFGLERLPLLRRQHVAERQLQARVGFLKFGARLRDAVDLREDFRIVQLRCLHQWIERGFFPRDGGVQVDQLHALLLENIVHLFALIGREAQLFRHLRVVPPFAAGAAAAWTTAGSTAIRMIARRRRPIGTLRECGRRRD
jgi:hypothetical protein